VPLARHSVRVVFALLALTCALPLSAARAQVATPQDVAPAEPPAVQPAPTDPVPAAPPAPRAPPVSDAPVAPPPSTEPNFETRTMPPLTEGAPPAPPPAQQPEFETRTMPPLTEGPPPVDKSSGRYLDGHERSGPFFSGPGSLTFILHHSLMGAAGGLVTQGISSRFSLELGSREGMLAGLLVGAGLGFGSSAWWQFNHWIDTPAANFGIAASFISGMFFTGLADLMTNDPSVLSWTAFAAAELGAWLSIGLGGGQLSVGSALAIGSGAAWALVYTGLLLAILGTSGNQLALESTADTLLIAPGLGAGFMALTLLRVQPTPRQVLRADMFGGAVGLGVLVLSGVVLGRFDIPTPYILSLLSSVAAIGAVSLLWEEEAERPQVFRAEPQDKRYRSVWW
jgi:hypothetical protein